MREQELQANIDRVKSDEIRINLEKNAVLFVLFVYLLLTVLISLTVFILIEGEMLGLNDIKDLTVKSIFSLIYSPDTCSI